MKSVNSHGNLKLYQKRIAKKSHGKKVTHQHRQDAFCSHAASAVRPTTGY
jgi:hypothetical protein